MTFKEFEERLSRLLQRPLGDMGFREKERFCFVRSFETRNEILSFGCRADGGSFKFSLTVGIRFIAVERLLRPESNDPSHPTILVPIHLLHQDRQFFEWSFPEGRDSSALSTQVVDEIRKHAIPFLEREGELSSVKSRLLSKTPDSWYVLSPEQRLLVLAAIYVIEGNSEEAVLIIDSALAESKNGPPKKRRRLEQLLDRIVKK